jgi:hypothetical protein
LIAYDKASLPERGRVRNQPAVVDWLGPALLYRSKTFEKL